ncbi:MAG: nuclear transport factor 2 family protein [Bacteroidota bacterium]
MKYKFGFKVALFLGSIMVLLVVIRCKSNQENPKSVVSSKAIVTELSKKLTEQLAEGNLDSIMRLYSEEIIYFPQYKSAVLSKDGLRSFYQEWTDSITFLEINRQIVDLDSIGDRIVETGIFSIRYSKDDRDFTYSGNYLTFWKKEVDSFKIEAESFCSDYWMPKDSLPYGFIAGDSISLDHTYSASAEIVDEILALNKKMINDIEVGNSKGRVEGFHRDAVYMPNFSKMLIGMDSIQPYLHKIYYPGSNIFVKQNYYDIRLIDDNHVLVAGHFKGGWNRVDNSGTFEGNMLNLRKRNDEGKLVMYRQISNSDR